MGILFDELHEDSGISLAETFAQNEYDSYIKIDFSVAPKEVMGLFEDISNLDYLFMRLQFIYQVELKPRKSVIIFDEVQKQPLARQAIKHLVKDRRYDYIETGSLISIKKNVKGIVIPRVSERIKAEKPAEEWSGFFTSA